MFATSKNIKDELIELEKDNSYDQILTKYKNDINCINKYNQELFKLYEKLDDYEINIFPNDLFFAALIGVLTTLFMEETFSKVLALNANGQLTLCSLFYQMIGKDTLPLLVSVIATIIICIIIYVDKRKFVKHKREIKKRINILELEKENILSPKKILIPKATCYYF